MGSEESCGIATANPRGHGRQASPAIAQHTLRSICASDSAGWAEDVRRLVACGSRHLRLQRCDREEIIENAILRVQVALSHKTPASDQEMRAILAMNARWAVDDFCREISRRTGRETLTEPLGMPDSPTPAPAPHATVEQRAAIQALLAPLNRRERVLIIERALLELDSHEIADRHHMRHAAARQAFSRAARKVREALQPA